MNDPKFEIACKHSFIEDKFIEFFEDMEDNNISPIINLNLGGMMYTPAVISNDIGKIKGITRVSCDHIDNYLSHDKYIIFPEVGDKNV